MKKIQIFVSSTHDDLIKERQSMVEGILNAGHIPAGMELFGGPDSIIKTIQKWINDSDMFILLLGGRYGSIYEDEGISYTEWEYQYAKKINKPVCVIVLSEKMLLQNAENMGKKNIFEEKYKKKYEKFKSSIMKKDICIEVSTLDGIISAVQTHINSTFNNPDYDLVGWVRGDSVIQNWKKVSPKVLEDTYFKVLENYVSKLYNNFDTQDFSRKIGKNFLSKLNFDGILDTFHRIVQFHKVDNGMIKVVIEDELEYSYLVPEHRGFGKLFQATKQQADTYKVEKLLIRNEEYTSQFKLMKQENANRGQFKYSVQSIKSIQMGDDFPVNIFYRASYECPAENFFQAYRLSYPCRNFAVEMYLEDELVDEYSILVSTNATLSKDYADSFKANEIKNFGVCRIKLQEWALPSDGYTATLKKRTENNH